MGRLILLLALGTLALIGWRRLRQLSPVQRRRYAWQITATALLGVLLLLLLTGRIHVLGALLAALVPVLRQLLPLAGRLLPSLFGHWQRKRFGPAGSGHAGSGPASDRSTVETATLRMTLDHSNGSIQGSVTSGPYAGSELAELDASSLYALYRLCEERDADSASLLASYFDQRLGANWRADCHGGEGDERSGAAGELSRAEALAILGLDESADRDAIVAAHRRLIQKLHPDRGGNDYLSAQINRARDVLLG